MTDHIFKNICIDFESLLQHSSFEHMVAIAIKQSKTPLAKTQADPLKAESYEPNEICPTYLGDWFEWFTQHFLNHFGTHFNIYDVQMTNREGSTEEDVGIDGIGKTIKDVNKRSKAPILAVANAPVYIQCKATQQKNHVFEVNESHLANFGFAALAAANVSGYAYKARMILITTGKGTHHHFKKMSRGLVEEIHFSKIKRLVDGDIVFLNKLRTSVGLKEFDVKVPTDNEFVDRNNC